MFAPFKRNIDLIKLSSRLSSYNLHSHSNEFLSEKLVIFHKISICCHLGLQDLIASSFHPFTCLHIPTAKGDMHVSK